MHDYVAIRSENMMRVAMLLLSVLALFQVNALQFGDLNVYAKEDISNAFVTNVLKSSLCVVRPRLGDALYSSDRLSHCDERQFYYLCGIGMTPCHDVFDIVNRKQLGCRWILRLSKSGGDNAVSLRSKEKNKGCYRPALAHDDTPLLAFLAHGISYEGISRLRYDVHIMGSGVDAEFVKTMCSDYANGLIDNLAYTVDSLSSRGDGICTTNSFYKKYLAVHERTSYLANVANPAMTLSRQEASELVYVTALCKGIVASAIQFNKMFDGVEPDFMVKIPANGCATEFGKCLYAAAVRNGIVGSGRRSVKGVRRVSGDR